MTKPLTAEERVVEALRAELRDVTAERDALRLEADGHRAARDVRTGERDDMYIALRDVTAERDHARGEIAAYRLDVAEMVRQLRGQVRDVKEETVVRITPAGQVLGTTYTLAPGAAATGVIETRCNCGGHLFHHDGCRGVAEQHQIDAEREHFASKGPNEDAADVLRKACGEKP